LKSSHSIVTSRLLLRELRDPDVDLLVDMLANPRVMRWLLSGKSMDAAGARAFIEKEFTFGSAAFGLGSLCEKNPEKLVGFAGIIPCRYLGAEDFEFGVAMLEDFWRKGYAKEIAEAEVLYGFENLPVDRLLALAHPRNAASLKIFDDLGMKFMEEISTDERGPRRIYVIEREAWACEVRRG